MRQGYQSKRAAQERTSECDNRAASRRGWMVGLNFAVFGQDSPCPPEVKGKRDRNVYFQDMIKESLFK